jgi:hypothetical protein
MSALIACIVLPTFLASIACSQTWGGVDYLGHQNLYASIGYNDCWGYTGPDGREYALLGVRSGASIVDMYFYRLVAGGRSETKRMVLIR